MNASSQAAKMPLPLLVKRVRELRVPYVVYRLLQVLPVVFLIIAVNFFLMRLAPGDLADVMAGESGTYSVDYANSLRQKFGLSQPVLSQYWAYVVKLSHLDLGWSYRNSQSVLSLVLERLSATALLVVSAVLIAAVLGSALGTVAALTRSRTIDAIISTLSTAGFATPLFWLGLLLVILFSAHLKWLPSNGMYELGGHLTGWSAFADRLSHMVLPVTCLTVFYLAIYTRLMRSTVKEILHQDYVRTARAKGASRFRTAMRHIIPNAMLGMITLMGLQFGTLFSGSITIEAVFGWPGLGQLTLSAVTSRDYDLLLGILFLSSLFVLLVNVLTEVSYAFLDPRIGLRK